MSNKKKRSEKRVKKKEQITIRDRVQRWLKEREEKRKAKREKEQELENKEEAEEKEEEKRQKKPISKGRKLREIFAYVTFGLMLGIDVILGYFLITNSGQYFNFKIDFGRSIELGILLVKMLFLVAILVVNLKGLKNVMKHWVEQTFIEDKIKEEAGERIKRLNIIRRAIFYWRVMGARKWLDKYNEDIRRIQRRVGTVRGNETKDLKKLKTELVKGILIWKDDFKVMRVEKDKKSGREKITDIPVTEEYLMTLTLNEIYEIYAIRVLETGGKFVNGFSEVEVEEEV